MRRKIPLIGAYLIALLIACVCTIGMCTSCDHFKKDDLKSDVDDSLSISELIYEYNNPVFESVTDVLDYKQEQEERQTLDSFVTNISENKLIAISSVLFKKFSVAISLVNGYIPSDMFPHNITLLYPSS